MPIIDIYSKRQNKGELSNSNGSLIYDKIPKKFRIQAIYIMERYLSESKETVFKQLNDYKHLVKYLCEEYGVEHLCDSINSYGVRLYKYELEEFLKNTDSYLNVLDVIELAFRYINGNYFNKRSSDAVQELNTRFEESSLGYRFENGIIIRVDSEFTHNEIIKPVSVLLYDRKYKGANDEFLKAAEHYKNGNTKDSIHWSCKAFESTMKTICIKRGWSYSETDTASKLIDVLFKNNLIPAFWQSKMSSLRSLLESGVPAARNKLSGHGQGDEVVDVPQHLASYILNMTASTILFLVETEKTHDA